MLTGEKSDFIWETLELAGQLIKNFQLKHRIGKKSLGLRVKNDKSLVTAVDIAAETLIIERIRKYFPKDTIVSEESCPELKGKNLKTKVWIIDPLDGTTNFAQGLDYYSTSIAFGETVPDEVRPTQILAGGVIDIPSGDVFLAARGEGAFCNQVRLQFKGDKGLENSLIASSFNVESFEENPGHYYDSPIRLANKNFSQLKKVFDRCQSIRANGSACLDICRTALGVIDLYWESGLKSWDLAASHLIVQEAGYYVAQIDNPNAAFDAFAGDILCGNPMAARELVDVIIPKKLKR